ncbi:MAG: hypothetical protein ACTSPO_02560 [Candidatus Heimdallarchaeaceae archaeon]
MGFSNIKTWLEDFKLKYPTLGRKFSQNPWTVHLYILFITLLLTGFIIWVHFLFENPKPDYIYLSIFIVLSILVGLYYNFTSMKTKSSILDNATIFLGFMNIILFNNFYILLITPIINVIIAFIYGIRRPHAMLYNFSMFMICIAPSFVFHNILQEIFSVSSYNFYLIAFLSPISFRLLNFLLMGIVISLATKQKILKTLMKFDFHRESFTLIFSVTTIILVYLDRNMFLFVAFFMIVMLRNELIAIKNHQNITNIRKIQLDSFGNPVFIIKGLLDKVQFHLKESDFASDEVENDIEMMNEMLERIQTQLDKMKNLEEK